MIVYEVDMCGYSDMHLLLGSFFLVEFSLF